MPLGIPTALFPIPRRFDPISSLPKARLALYKDHFMGNHLWESFGRSDDRRFRPDGQRPTQNPKTGPEAEELNQSRSYKRRSMQHDQGWFSDNGVAREPRTRLDSQEPALKPMLDPKIKKYEDDQEMSHRWIPWHTGAKFFKKGFEKFRRKIVQLSGSYHSSVQRR